MGMSRPGQQLEITLTIDAKGGRQAAATYNERKRSRFRRAESVENQAPLSSDEVRVTIKICLQQPGPAPILGLGRVMRRLCVAPSDAEPDLGLGLEATMLKFVSAYPDDEFLKCIYESLHKRFAATKHSPAQTSKVLREPPARPVDDGLLPLPGFATISDEELQRSQESNYEQDESVQSIQSHYDNCLQLLKFTLPRLLRDEGFRSTIVELQSDGWRDWHILLAIVRIRLNYVTRQITPKWSKSEEYQETYRRFLQHAEEEADPAPLVDLFTIEEMRQALMLSQLAILRGMGFDCRQELHVSKAVDAFRRRFNYWTDDVKHGDPFAESENRPMAGR